MTSAVADAPADQQSKGKELSDKNFLILGCGPAGLIAARTLEKNGVDTDHIEIVAQERRPSKITGAQFLHAPIIGDPLRPDGQISIVKIGFKDVYANKVYGDGLKPTSFDGARSSVDAWSLIKQYEQLWEDYFPGIVEMTVNEGVMNEFLDCGEYDEIISTVPPACYCTNSVHSFPYTPILLGEPLDPMPFDNIVVYSGRPEDKWYRISNIFGEDGIEFGLEGHDDGGRAEQLTQVARELVWNEPIMQGKKPLGTDCDCGYGRRANLLRVGRFGQWDRKVLLHQVPAQVASIL